MSIVSISLLVTGSSADERFKKALEIAAGLSSKYDVDILDTTVENGIDQIRNLSSKINKSPLNSKYTTLIIKESQHLTLEAQNALLKTLEEPPPRAKIILTAPNSLSVLSTIASRCLEIKAPNSSKKARLEMKQYFSKNFFDRYTAVEKLDLDEWTLIWRDKLIENFSGPDFEIRTVAKILNYLKLILKLKSLKRKNLSNKLINTYLLLQIPKTS